MRPKNLALLIAFGVASTTGVVGGDERSEIEAVVRTAYIEGVHLERDVEKMRSGFHESFIMLISRADELSSLGRDDWIERILGWKRDEPSLDFVASGEIVDVEVTGDAAVVKVEIHRDGELVFTDYLSLYRFEDGWKIVAKTFFDHR